MPLRDHFHPPLYNTHTWESFHARWSIAISDDLNRRLPKRFLASAPHHLGPFAAADVAELDTLPPEDRESLNGVHEHDSDANGGGVGLAVETYAPPTTALTMPANFPDEFLVEIRDTRSTMRVVGVIELVSPGNKDREGACEQFAGKCLSYLSHGIGLVVIDTVTDRLANLHNVMMRLANNDAKYFMADDPPQYVAAFRPNSMKVKNSFQSVIDLWTWPLTVGAELPVVPLALKGYRTIRLDLEATYREACERSRIP